MKRKILILCSLLLLVSGVLGAFFVSHRAPTPAHAVGVSTDWTMFGGDLGHSGYNAAESILNATTIATLNKKPPLWTVHAGAGISSQVTEANGLLYWGSWDGYEHATDLTGKEVWKYNMGTESVTGTCYPPTAGPSGAAAIASVPINGTTTSVAFVSGGDSNLYAMNAITGAKIWNVSLGTAPSYMLWAGPIVYNGNVYVGISSYGDCPLIPGKLFQINASTGTILHSYTTVPNGCAGGGIWDTPTIDAATGMLYVSTGTRTLQCSSHETMAMALLAFHTADISTLADYWSVPDAQGPGDSDFGSTPMLFQATIGGVAKQMVGLMNKNGYYYAFDRANLQAGPVWSKQVAVSNFNGGGNSFATSAWDGSKIYEAGVLTTINGAQCLGHIRAMDPATGNFLWEACLPNRVESSVMAVPGLVEVGAGSQIIALDSTTGKQVFTYTDPTAGSRLSASGTIVNGVLYHGNRAGNLYAFGTGTTPPPPTPTPTGTPPPTPPGPVAKTWNFAEGRVGAGFREYLTIDNPTQNACTASIKYLYTIDGTAPSAPKTVTVPVPAKSRATQPVNADLGIADSTTPAATVAAAVTVAASTPACTGFVAERPEYFTNYHGLSSGTNVLGSTALGTTFNFADVPSGSGFNSYLTILNPGTTTANVTVSYYAGGKVAGTQTLSVAATSRGTLAPAAVTPALPTHSAAVVTSNVPVMVERPTYISNVNGFSGAADVVGAQVLAKDWLFAEGYATANSQESLTIGNMNPKPATVTITLKSKTGATNPVNVTVPGQSQLIWSVNANNNFSGASPEVSAEVVSTGAAAISIVVQREMYYQYNHTLPNGTLQTNSVTDVIGMVAANAASAYSFAEGYTNTGYHEWLTLQNSTTNAETIYITLMNGSGKSTVQSVSVVANSRYTVDITQMVQQNLAQPGDIPGNEVSMTVQTLNNGGAFVAERPEYFNTTGSAFVALGGTDIIGF